MALKKTIVFKGIDVRDAYFKVWNFQGAKDFLQVSVSMFAVIDGEMLDSKQYSIPYVLDGENPIKQAYEYLKTLPEFENAVDC